MTEDPSSTAADQDHQPAMLRPRRKGIYILPNAVTLAALFASFYSIVMAMNGRFEIACIAIFLSLIHISEPTRPY